MKNMGIAFVGLGLVLVVLCGGVDQSLAAGGISIAPTRVIMDGNSRIATIYLSNKGDKAATFRVMLRDKEMLTSGQICDLAEGETILNSATDYIRYSPRRVRIPAYGHQTVRLKLQNPKSGSLTRGEYRTHLVFLSIPEDAPGDDGRLHARAIIETSIPVIVRRQKPAATARLSEARIDTLSGPDGRPRLNLVLHRDGDRSIYGDVKVVLQGDGRKSETLSRVNGLAVYFPTPYRELSLPLDLPPGRSLERGTLMIEFSETEAGKGDLRTRLTVPLDADAFALK